MDLAGLNIVMDADFSSVFSSFAQANTMAQNFVSNLKNAFNGIPDLGKKLNFTTNGASQAAQELRENARAAREQAAADLDAARAKDIADRAQERANRTSRAAKDEYAQLVAASQSLVRAYYNEAAAQLRVGNATDAQRAALEEMRKAALASQQQLNQIEQGAGRFQRQVGNYAVGTAALAQQLRTITTELPNFFISARIGFQSLSNNLPGIFNELTRLREANVQLAASGQPTVSIFKQFLSAFNPLNIAIGVGVGLLTAYGPELLSVAKGWFAGSQAAQQQAANIKELDEATKKITKTSTENANKEVSNAMLLYKTSQDVKLSYEERKYAANELIKIAPTVFKGLNDEAIVAGKAESAYRKLIEAIKDKVALSVNEEQVTILYKQQQAALNYSKALQIAKKAQTDLENANEADVSGAGIEAAKIAKKAQEDIAKLGVTIPVVATGKNILEASENLAKANANLDEKINETATLKGRLDSIFQSAPPKTPITHVVHDINTALDDLISKNAEVDLQLSDSSITAEDAIKQKLNNYKNYVREITKTSDFKVGIDDSRVVSANQQIKSLSETLDNLKKNNSVDDILKTYNDSIQSIGDNQLDGVITEVDAIRQSMNAANVAKKALLKIDTDGQFTGFIDGFTESIKALSNELLDANLQEEGRKLNATFESISSQLGAGLITNTDAAAQKVSALKSEIKKLIELNKDGSLNQAIDDLNEQLDSAKIEEKVANLTDALNETLKSSLAQSAQILGEGIGNLIAGTGGIGDIFKGIASMLAEQMVQFGKQIIAAAVAFQIAQGALTALVSNPALAAVAGAGLILAGEVIKSQLANKGKKVGKFADGGIISGPTLGLMGEYAHARSNPEVVAPLDKLQTILKNSGGGNREQVPYILTADISGEKLRLLLQRAERSYRR
jgi:hypothetical protein